MSLNATSTPGYTFAASASVNGSGGADPVSFLYPHHSASVAKILISTAQALVNPRGKGIYATDETPEGIEARLVAAAGEDGKGKVWTEAEKKERRRRWRECLYESLPTGHCLSVSCIHHRTYSESLLAQIIYLESSCTLRRS